MTTTSPTNDEYENIFQILVKDVDVSMSRSRISHTTIGSTSLGPCLFFLLDFCLSDLPCCYGHHYSYIFDEKGLKDLDINSILPERSAEKKVFNFRLLISGGDEEEGYEIRESFSLLNKNEIEIMNTKPMNVRDVLHLYEQLVGRTTIIQCTTRVMSDSQEAKGKLLELTMEKSQ